MQAAVALLVGPFTVSWNRPELWGRHTQRKHPMSISADVVFVVDIDGVAYDFVTESGHAAARVTGQPRARFVPAETWDFFINEWGLTLEEFLDIYRAGVLHHDLVRTGVPLPGTVSGWSTLRDLGVHVHVVTDCGVSGVVYEARQARKEWLAEWGLTFDALTFTGDKGAVVADHVAAGRQVFAVDDRPRNLDEMSAAGAHTIRAVQRWNRDYTSAAFDALTLADAAAWVASRIAAPAAV